MEKKISSAVDRYGLEDIYSGCVIGYSGGADSGALLHYLKDRCKNLLAVHINHMIRGEEAQRDEDFCRRTCEKYGVELLVVKIDVPTLAAQRKAGLEETARNERYRVFKEILSQRPQYKCIVTAHNANDNCETVVFNLCRGSGTKGLSGINPKNGEIYRPLILSTRSEIIEYCTVNNIEYVTDSTNSDTDYTRNYIRYRVLPSVLEINPSLPDAIFRTAELLRQDEEYIASLADKIFSGCEGGRLQKSVAQSTHKSVLSRLIKKMAGVNLDYTSVCAVLDLISSWHTGKRLCLGGGLVFKLEHSYCCFITEDLIEEREFSVPLSEKETDLYEYKICVNSDTCDPLYDRVGTVWLNSRSVKGEMYARNKRDGDTVKSGGVTKKLKKIFTDKHVPSHERGKIPVICDEDGVLTVVGIVARDGAFDRHGDTVINVYKRRY